MKLKQVSGYTLSYNGKNIFLTNTELIKFYKQTKKLLGQHIIRPSNIVGLFGAIEQITGVTEEQIIGPSRREVIVFARYTFCHVACHKFGMSDMEISKIINRYHTVPSLYRNNYVIKEKFLGKFNIICKAYGSKF